MDDFFVGLLAATLRVATPLLLATLGELYAERAGILNLGIEGTMFLGAFVGFMFADKTSSLGVGLAATIGAGALLAVRLGVSQHVSGLSGHAVVAKLLPKTDPVHKVTIIPRGRIEPFGRL